MSTLNERGAARYLGVSPATLKTWRSRNRGPRWQKAGRRVSYQLADLQEFQQACVEEIKVRRNKRQVKNRPLYLWSMEELEAVGRTLRETVMWARKMKE